MWPVKILISRANLRWTHMSEGTFSQVVAHLFKGTFVWLLLIIFLYEPRHITSLKVAFVDLRMVIRVFAIRLKTLWILGFSQNTLTDCADVRADLSVRTYNHVGDAVLRLILRYSKVTVFIDCVFFFHYLILFSSWFNWDNVIYPCNACNRKIILNLEILTSACILLDKLIT